MALFIDDVDYDNKKAAKIAIETLFISGGKGRTPKKKTRAKL